MATTPATRDPRRVLGRRVGAYLIDAAIGVAISAILFFALAESVEIPSDVEVGEACDIIEDAVGASLCFTTDDTAFYTSDTDAFWVIVSPVAYWLVLHGVVQGLTGATIGKAMLGLRCVDEQGRICGVPKALGRTVVGFVDFSVLTPAVGFTVALVRDDRRRLGDMAARTNVVRTSDVGRPPGVATAPAVGQWTPPPPGQTSTTAQPYETPDAVPPPAAEAPRAVPPGADEGPVWDADRGAYVQIQPGSGRLLVFDDESQSWRPAD